MASVAVEIKTQGFERAQRKLRQLGAIRFEPVLDRIGGTVEAQTLGHFEVERGPDGQPWKPLADATVVRKLGGRRKVYGKRGRMLARARRGMASLKILQDESWQGGLISTIAYRVGNNEVVVGADKVYAAIQQFGGVEVGRPGLPARPYLGLSQQELAEVERVIEDWIAEQLKP